MTDQDPVQQATELWQQGCRLQMAGERDGAIEAYRRSIEIHPTAEAHTYLGWTYSFQGKIDEATAEWFQGFQELLATLLVVTELTRLAGRQKMDIGLLFGDVDADKRVEGCGSVHDGLPTLWMRARRPAGRTALAAVRATS